MSQIIDFVQGYAKLSGRSIHCYVPTRPLLNYSHWRIVSPESSLVQVGADGYIAQVWTGTSRTPNIYEGRRKERTFETAFLEYGAMQNLVRASGRRVWYLNDPVEDNPNHLGRLPDELGEHSDSVPVSTGSVEIRNHAVAGTSLQRQVSRQRFIRYPARPTARTYSDWYWAGWLWSPEPGQANLHSERVRD